RSAFHLHRYPLHTKSPEPIPHSEGGLHVVPLQLSSLLASAGSRSFEPLLSILFRSKVDSYRLLSFVPPHPASATIIATLAHSVPDELVVCTSPLKSRTTDLPPELPFT